MKIHCIPVGGMGANCYITWCENTKEALVVDPGGDAARIADFIAAEGLKVKYIVNTHGHIDHIAANDELRKKTGASLMIHTLESQMLEDSKLNLSAFLGFSQSFKPADRLLSDGDTFEVGDLTFMVIHTPGHTKGGICLISEGVLFTGDTLFSGSVGRSDFPGGNPDILIDSIKQKLLVLPDETRVYPGHMEDTTISREKKNNPYLG